MRTFEDRVAALEAEFAAVETDLADPATLSDPDRLRDLSRRHKELGEIVRTWHDLNAAREDVATAREMLTESAGDERELRREEVDDAEQRCSRSRSGSRRSCCPRTPTRGAT